MSSVDLAIERAGGVTALARFLNLKHPTIIGWKLRGKVPAERVHEVAAATGLSPEELRPDLFGGPRARGAA